MKPTITILASLARTAGEILRAGFGGRQNIQLKGAIDLVTEYDHRSEAYLLGEIRRLFPKHRIIAEESGGLAGNDDCCWYIDPLDGTVNYAHGLPIYSVSIAYAERGTVQLGAVYDPSRDELFTAQREKGARLNRRPILVSDTSDMNRALLVTGFPYDIRTNPQNNLDHYARFAIRTQAVRRLGSAALDFCYVGCGRFDGYWEIRLAPWDMAAGALIAREAGALVTDLHGCQSSLLPPCSALAANPALHTQMLDILGQQGQSEN